MTDYDILDALPSRENEIEEHKPNDERQIISIETYRAIEYRDKDNKIYHSYKLSPQIHDLNHYFRYIELGFRDLDHRQFKYCFVYSIIDIIKKIATQRKYVSILEIGGTIGENYEVLIDELHRQKIEIMVDFVVLDISLNAVALGRRIHHGNERIHFVVSEASDLSRFPDQAFDLVVSNDVFQIAAEPEMAFREAFRTSRVAMLSQGTIATGETKVFTSEALPSRKHTLLSIEQILDEVTSVGCRHCYNLNQSWAVHTADRRTSQSDGVFGNTADPRLFVWNSLIFSRYSVYPELAQFDLLAKVD